MRRRRSAKNGPQASPEASLTTAASGAAWSTYAPALLLMLLTFAVYANTFPGSFFIDDIYIVVNNPLVESLDIGAIFSTDYWGRGNDTSLFRPLTIFSFAVNRLLLGQEAWSFHLVNVLLHGAVSVLLYALLRSWNLTCGRSLFAAALFAVHPIHTEVVNEAVGRSELLVALLFLLGLRLAHSNRPLPLAAAGGCYLAALLAKEHAISFLGVLLLVDLFLRRDFKKRLPFYGGVLVIALGWLYYRHFFDRGPITQTTYSSLLNVIYSPLRAMPALERVLTALKIQVLYLGKLLWPTGLQGVYSGPAIATPLQSLFTPWGGVILTVMAASLALAVYGWRQRQMYGLAVLLYVTSFAVTSNIFFPTEVAMAERFAYLPSIWFCLAVATALPGVGLAPGWRNWGGAALVGVPLLVGAGATWARNYDFRDQESLWSRDFERDPQNVMAGIFVIDAYIQKKDYAKAEQACRTILSYHPNLLESLEDLAWILVRQNQPQAALQYANQAVEARPEFLSGKLLTTMVEIHVLLHQPQEVLQWLDRIPLEGQPGFYWELRGKAYEELGELQLAVDSYRQVGEPPPGSEVPARLERLLLQLGQNEEAKKVQQWIKERAAAPGAVAQ